MRLWVYVVGGVFALSALIGAVALNVADIFACLELLQ